MAQFGGTGKNPPWVRNTATSLGQPTQLLGQGAPGVATAPSLSQAAVLQQQQQAAAAAAVATQAQAYNTAAGLTALGLTQVGLVLQQQQQVAAQQAANQNQSAGLGALGMGQPGIALPTTLVTAPVQTVSYPTPRVLQQAPPPQFQQQPQQPQQPQTKQRVFTGTVTKLHENFGFVDEDVFFQTSCVKGTMPKVGDRVLVEATYNPNMPFKWNATRIQVLPNQTMQDVLNEIHWMGQQSQVANTVGGHGPGLGLGRQSMLQGHPPPITPANIQPQPPSYNQVPPPAALNAVGMNRLPSNNSVPSLVPRRHSPTPILRRDRDREMRSSRDDMRARDDIRLQREDRRDRERDRERERERHDRTVQPRKRSRSPRARSRSPPWRRARVVPRYMVQVPKISLDMKEANVMELKKRYTNMYVPSDFFLSSFVWMDAFPLQRPFTFDHPCTFHIMHKDVNSLIENVSILEPPDADHQFSAKVMLLSSPPLEEIFRKSCALAEDPSDIRDNFVHPTRLLHFLVGLKGKNETMAIGGSWSASLDGADPEGDPRVLVRTAIRTCLALTGIDLSACTKWYRFAEVYYRRGETTHKGRVVPARVETVVIFLPDVWSCTPTRLEWDGLAANYKKQLQKKLRDETEEPSENQEEEETSVVDEDVKKDPTHHSELDPKTMKVADLRQELEARSLNSKGLKSQLVARLSKALKVEAEKEDQTSDAKVEGASGDPMAIDDDKQEAAEKEEEKKKSDEEDRKQKEERERQMLERRYSLPDAPAIVVHPSRMAKGGKFDCTVMSLSVLLDYRQEDNKEHSFEVSLFAELFNEMMMRDFGFSIYRALSAAPEKREDEKDKEKDKKKKEEKDNKKEDKDDKKDKKDDVDRKDKDKREERKRKDDKEKEDEKSMDDEDKEDDTEEDDGEEEESEDKKEKDRSKKDDKEKKRDKDKRKDKVKMVTIDPGLLLSFVYYDQNHCGYLFEKDLEEILHMLGLTLSRAQVRKVLQKVVSRDTLNYRKLTDKPRGKDGEDKEKALEEKMEVVGEQNPSNAEECSQGNKLLLPSFRLENGAPQRDPAVAAGEGNECETLAEPNAGMVMYNGALVDIDRLVQQLQRSERARSDTELKLKDMQLERDGAKEMADTAEQSSSKLAQELQEHKIRLQSSDDALRRSQDLYRRYFETLRTCHSKMSTLLADHREETPIAESGQDKTIPPVVKLDVRDSNGKRVIKTEPMENGDV